MWEKCVGCGEGLFAGDAFCGNCGRPVKPAIPPAREPGGLESGPLTAPAAGGSQVRIIPARGADLPARKDHAPSPGAAPAPDTARQKDTAQQNGTGPHDGTGRAHGAIRADGAVPRDRVFPGRGAGQPQGPATTHSEAPGPGRPARPLPAKLSGLANLDPARNPRFLMCVLRQAGVFAGLYLLLEALLLLGLLLATAAGTRWGPALRVELDSLWLAALVLAFPFWLIPVPALLAEWSQVMEQDSEATHTAFDHINSAFRSHDTPVDSLRVRTAFRHGEGDREYLELRRGHFSGYISCFAHGRDLYIGWTFWLHMSPLRLLMMIMARNIQDMTSRRDGIRRSLRFESIRALVAAMHGASLAGIDAASIEPGPPGPLPAKETTVDMNVRMG